MLLRRAVWRIESTSLPRRLRHSIFAIRLENFSSESPVKPEIVRETSFPYHSRVDHRSSPPVNHAKNIERIVKRYSDKKPTPGTLQQLIAMSNPKHRLSWGPHIQTELLVRMTHRVSDFKRLPTQLLQQKSVMAVIDMYQSYLEQIDSLDSTDTAELNREFVRLLTEFKAKDSSTLPLIALGIQNWQQHCQTHRVDKDLAAQLDDLFTARLSIRMLIGQYCEHANPKTPGRIERGLVVTEVVEEAKQRVNKMCMERFGMCPEIEVQGNLNSRLTYVRSYLHHILAELLKNSTRAVVEKHGKSGTLPPIIVVIGGGKEDCVIKVSDEGGGIPRSGLDKIWSYQFTTGSEREEKDLTFRGSFYGSGYGLPIARVFARYFGGDLDVISTEGWGTDAYVYIQRIESSAVEVLPD